MVDRNAVNRTMYLVSLYSIVLNTMLALIKFFLGKYSGSTALTADAIHSGIDVFSSILVLTGMFFSYKKAKNCPFGLYKLENFISAFVSILIILTAFEIGKGIFERTESLNTSLNSKIITIIILALVVELVFLYSKYEKKIGIKYGSPGIIADAEHIKSDMLSLFVLMINILLSIFKVNIDKYVAFLIVVFIAYSGWRLLKESVMVLLDVSVDYSVIENIRNIILAFPQVIEITEIKGRKAGRYIFIDISLKFNIVTLEEAHRLSNMIEEEIYDNQPNIDKVMIHYEPYQKQQVRIAIPLTAPEIKEISMKFGESPFFALITYDLKEKQIISEEIEENKNTNLTKKRGIKTALWILNEKKADIVIAAPDIKDSATYFVFKANNKEIYFTDEKKMINLDRFIEKTLSESKYSQ
ncbi:MAG: cation diffusion facilitator family transporter [Thermoanaerobacteraceae bacterium]|nr:cation diffusion facilitator family transporter [Thermoanaerobacteraceae bacterium]